MTSSGHVRQQGGGFSSADRGPVCCFQEESAPDNVPQLGSDKECSDREYFLRAQNKAFHVATRRSHSLSDMKGLVSGGGSRLTCLRGREEWEVDGRFYLGATQLQITQQITLIMIKGEE